MTSFLQGLLKGVIDAPRACFASAIAMWRVLFSTTHQRFEVRHYDVEERIAVQTAFRNIFIRDLCLALPMTDEARARNRVECEEWRAALETSLRQCPQIRAVLPEISEAAWNQAKRAMKICHNKDIGEEKP